MKGPAIDFAALRERLAQSRGRQYWRSLEELAQTPEFQKQLHDEFAPGIMDAPDVGRRRVLQLLGASLGLAGLSACTRQPQEKIVPYVHAPEEFVPGKPLFYATAWVVSGLATGVLVESHMGRPTKVEGNPEHPASLGGTDAFAQASILSLYDPDRSKVVIRQGRISGWVNFLAAMEQERERLLGKRGAGLRILTETVTSPALAQQLRKLLGLFPEARWHQYEPVSRDSARQGAIHAFGQPVNTLHHLRDAKVLLSLDSDFLGSGPAATRYSRDFTAARQAQGEHAAMNRLYVVEPAPSVTGSLADHRLPATNREVEQFTRSLAAKLGVSIPAPSDAPHAQWLAVVAGDLRKNSGASVVIAGDQQPPIVHALAHAMNQALGNAGKTVIYTDPVEAEPVDQLSSLRELAKDMAAGTVETLVILGGNPVYNAPADLMFRDHLNKVHLRIHSGLYEDETSELCHWHLPEAHPYEAWGDARAYDGTVTIMQPLIAPLYAGRPRLQILAALNGESTKTDHELVHEYWQSRRSGAEFESFWKKSLHDGFVAGSELPPRTVALKADFTVPQPPPRQGIEISFRPDPTIWDGSFANNGWLQELPKPLTKLTWENTVLLSPATAERLQLFNGDMVELRLGERRVTAPVWLLPGHAAEAVTVHLGYGRTRGGKLATGAGFNAYLLQNSSQPWSAAGVEIRKTGRKAALACTQDHHSMEGRPLVRTATVEEFEKTPHFAQHVVHEPGPELTLFPVVPYDGYKWGMTIDLNACTGCSACVVACQAENNIPLVGKDGVLRQREMHWIRVDRYFSEDLDDPTVYNQPVPCMHCETAPCEVVCPVNATVHSEEGLNQMVYNRCVGTRYCANNCPYKVRRFNFLRYIDWESPSLKMLRNPNVTVRSRGVMEKCTYCVQRINSARISAEKEDRKIRDGEVVPACAQACPTQAIIFGDMNDPDSRVAKLKKDPRNYGILTELNTKPRTTYLARLRNPNPELEKS
jgi:molybdopterin-containing oxidoreductase family iron-sulfur binding subunit